MKLKNKKGALGETKRTLGMDSDEPPSRPTMTQVAAAALVHLSFEGPPSCLDRDSQSLISFSSLMAPWQ